jgi:RecA/RadA recombinase
VVHFKGPHYEGLLTPDDLAFILHHGIQNMSTFKLFAKRDDVRKAVDTKNITAHKARKMGVGTIVTADFQPPYENGLERIPTGLVQLDHALKGGVTPGTVIGLWGEKHIGKSTLSYRLEAAILNYYGEKVRAFALENGASPEEAEAAAANERGLAISTEGYDSSYASRLGVRPEQVLRPRFEYGEQLLQYVVDNVKQNVADFADYKEPGVFSYMLPITLRYYKIDSTDALKFYADEHGAKGKENVLKDNTQIGARASALSQFFRVAAAAPAVPITAIWISQERTNIAGTTAWKDGLRGNAYAHNIRLEIRMKKNGSAPKPEDTTRLVDLEFRQLQMAGGTNLTEREVVTLVQRLSGGFYPKDQAVYEASNRGILNIKGGGHWEYVTRDGESVSSSTTGARKSDIGVIADALEEADPRLIDEIYQRVLNAMAGRERDDDGTTTAAVDTTADAPADDVELAEEA